MGLNDGVNLDDPRLQPGALVSQTAPIVRLAEVLQIKQDYAHMEDCKTEGLICIRAWNVVREWKLVRPAPNAPDHLPLSGRNP
jgi:hypothetical protein